MTTFTGTYDSNTASFDTPPSGVMPWWNNSSLAQQFVVALGNGLGFPLFGVGGPLFAYNVTPNTPTNDINFQMFLSNNSIQDTVTGSNQSQAYAQAVLIPPASVPGPLPLLGAATAFGMSRRLRRRISTQPYKL